MNHQICLALLVFFLAEILPAQNDALSRHCEQSEAISASQQQTTRLLRYAGNDEQLSSSEGANCPDARYTLAEVCAPLLVQLDELGLTSALQLSSAQSANPELIAQLNQLIVQMQSSQAETSTSDPKLLEQILAKHYAFAPIKERGLTDRLVDWWNSLFNDEDRNDSFNSDFFDALAPSETFARLLFYLLSGLMLAFILVHGWRELTPLMRSYQVERKKRLLQAANALPVWPPVLQGESLDSQMAKIYSTVVAYLSQRSALPDAPSLTHAEASVEIGGAAIKPELQTDFQALAQQASNSLFAAQPPSEAELQASLQKADALIRASQKSPAKRAPDA